AVATCKQALDLRSLWSKMPHHIPAALAAGANVCDCPGSYTAGFPIHPFSTSCTSQQACLHVATAPLAANTASVK
ncbi:MAG: hypothetical protein J6D01_03665, partial [Muribaculaceae bacterium]|nr:hypothetical protein [Muribaculaceae bacterium]